MEHLGLDVTRLIRIAYGPFQLGELARGGVEEVPRRVLREQLGDAAPVRHAHRRRPA
jgi:23S rRNA pseudouridine2605 synthase